MIRLSIILACVLATFAATARASALPYPMSKTTGIAYTESLRVWGTGFCNTNVTIRWVPLRSPLAGLAYRRQCRIDLDTRTASRLRAHRKALYCTLILHEMGHISGYHPPTRHADPGDPHHSTNPRSVMSGTSLRIDDPRCARLFPR